MRRKVASDLAKTVKGAEVSSLLTQLNDVRDRERDIKQKAQRDIDNAARPPFNRSNELSDLRSQLSKAKKKEDKEQLKEQIDGIQMQTKMEEDRIANKDRDVKKAEDNRDAELLPLKESEKQIQDALLSSSKGLEYNSLIIRVAAVLLIVFLVQTFITVFRYLTRLAAYYQGRVDSLCLIAGREVTIDNLRDLTTVFSPESYDFGKPPRGPAEQALDLAKVIITSQRKEKEKEN